MAVVALANFSLPSTEMVMRLNLSGNNMSSHNVLFRLMGLCRRYRSAFVRRVQPLRLRLHFPFYPLIPFNGKRLLKKFFRLKLRSDRE